MSPMPPPAAGASASASAAVVGPPDPPVPAWLRGLPRAPEYRPTESEFADPIGFLSRVEREAAAYGICKVIPPYARPSRRFVFAHLNRSLVSSSESPPIPTASDDSSSPASLSPPAPAAAFTTRHQELGTPRRGRPPPQVLKQVWQSGERYTLEQFEAKARAFSKAHLAGVHEPTPLTVESLFWKASADRPIYIEYANDVPGSGFAAPAQSQRQKKRKREGVVMEEGDKSAGWRLSNSPWNLQAIARAPGSVTRFMPDDVPGVTSPMMYIGMLFSWFAWHVEDHELHSLNFLHTGAPKTWYAVPGDQAVDLEEVIRVHGYGGNPDRIASLAVLGEKTTLMSPEVLVARGVPCCRLVQYPGEFVVTFPRAYHVGFSHGFNCGEAANFATPQWLKFAKEAAIRRAVMNYLPMLSHQQLLYLLAVSFISRTSRELLCGIRTSRLRDRRKEERELLVKQEFLQDMINENELLCSFLEKISIDNAVLWEPDLLPSPIAVHSSSSSSKASEKKTFDVHRIESIQCKSIGSSSSEGTGCTFGTQSKCMSEDSKAISKEEKLDDEDGLPFDLSIDSGSLTCVACGILGYPFMVILQPCKKALEDISLFDKERHKLSCEKENCLNALPCSPDNGDSGSSLIANRSSSPVNNANFSHQNVKQHKDIVPSMEKELDRALRQHSSTSHSCSSENTHHPGNNTETPEKKIPNGSLGSDLGEQTSRGGINAQAVEGCGNTINWNTSCAFARPRIFCLQHALEIEKLLEGKGGAHALVICHADYVKIKALAISIAEEIEFQFDCKDVALANASKSDLHLINISIDDEGHEEEGRDWTSQMGLNLKYCSKMRKEISGSQEQPPLSFWGLFSKPSAISVVPNLKWFCRKARTPYKVVGNVPCSDVAAIADKVMPAVTETKIDTSGPTYESDKNEQIFQLMQESDNVAEVCTSSNENDEDGHRLIAIPISLAEYPMMHQVCEGPVSVSTCDDTISSLNSLDSSPFAAVSAAEFTREQQGVETTELSSSTTLSVEQFVDNDEGSTEEGSMDFISNQEYLESHNVTSECKDKQLYVQQDQEDMLLSNNPSKNLMFPCPIKGVASTGELHGAAVSDNCGKTSYCSDTVLKTNKSATYDQPDTHDHPDAALVKPMSSYDQVVSSVDGRCSLTVGCPVSTDASCSTDQLSSSHDLMDDELQAINSEPLIGSLNQIQVDTSPSNAEAIKLKFHILTKLQHESPEIDAMVSEEMQAAPATAISGHDGMSVYGESNSFDILLGALADESKVADAPEKDEVGKASLTLMTLASNDHTADYVTQRQVIEITASSVSAALSNNGQICTNLDTDKLLAIQIPEIPENQGNIKEVDGWKHQSFKADTGILDSSASGTATTLLPKTDTILGSPKVDQYVDRPHDLCASDIVSRSIGSSNRTDIICYARRKRKRKSESNLNADSSQSRGSFVRSQLNTDSSKSLGSFARSPCESLRPRTKPAVVEDMATETETVETSAVKKEKRAEVGIFQCDIELCDMSFETRAELRAHQRNICTDESCGKRFRSHKYLKRHQCVHRDERPLKCPWNGCPMTFKWLWAQTEHVRVHTGERPYKCSAPDCSQSFRYVSDYSRHRKKFNHY